MHSELIIIGAGPGGYETAVAAAKQADLVLHHILTQPDRS